MSFSFTKKGAVGATMIDNLNVISDNVIASTWSFICSQVSVCPQVTVPFVHLSSLHCLCSRKCLKFISAGFFSSGLIQDCCLNNLTCLIASKAKELQTLHNLRKLFVQDLATRVKKVNYCGYDLDCGVITSTPLLLIQVLILVFLSLYRVLRWTLTTQAAAQHRNRKYPFLRTILSNSPRFTNR